jgi:hypothetical protein
MFFRFIKGKFWEEIRKWPRHGKQGLFWLLGPNFGWNECSNVFDLAASSPKHPLHPVVYQKERTQGENLQNGKSYSGYTLLLGFTIIHN